MVPKIASGGAGFIGAGRYYLGEGKPPRDGAAAENAGGIAGYMLGEGRSSGGGSVPPGFDPVTGERVTRVGHTTTRHLPTEDPKQAFRLMQDRYEAYLVERAHKPGRRLKEPVYAYSLSWAPGEEPEWAEMLLAAETSLTVLGMDEHQAVIVEHRDKAYRHIHVVVNRVHPTASRTTHTSMDQFKLSRWAQAFEVERGQVWCAQRVENNAQRDGGAAVKDTVSRSRAEIEAERAGAAADIRGWRAEQDALRRQEHLGERQALWARQQGERQALEAGTRAGIATAQQAIKARHRPAWRAVYRAEKQHLRHVAMRRRGILERAVHAVVHARELGFGTGLSAGEIALFALSKRALLDRIKAVHQAERAALSARQLFEHRAAAKAAWAHHHEALRPIRLRHAAERDALTGEIRADWTILRRVRREGEDQAFFEARQAGAVSQGQDAPPEPPQGSGARGMPFRPDAASRLTQVWGLFRSRFKSLQATEAEHAAAPQLPSPQAVPDRAWLRDQPETSQSDRHDAGRVLAGDADQTVMDAQHDGGMER